VDSHALWGLKVGRDAGRGISWFVEGRNLADRVYASTTGVIADARGLDSAQFLPGDGRSVYAGISWSAN
jgi:iron complex outermembrane receptor protein